jgi:hypothetical protein
MGGDGQNLLKTSAPLPLRVAYRPYHFQPHTSRYTVPLRCWNRSLEFKSVFSLTILVKYQQFSVKGNQPTATTFDPFSSRCMVRFIFIPAVPVCSLFDRKGR